MAQIKSNRGVLNAETLNVEKTIFDFKNFQLYPGLMFCLIILSIVIEFEKQFLFSRKMGCTLRIVATKH